MTRQEIIDRLGAPLPHNEEIDLSYLCGGIRSVRFDIKSRGEGWDVGPSTVWILFNKEGRVEGKLLRTIVPRNAIPYRVSDVRVEESRPLFKKRVEGIPRLHKGDVYDEGLVEDDVRTIEDVYGWCGYSARVSRLLDIDSGAETGLVRVTYLVEISTVHISNIQIPGSRLPALPRR